MRRDNGTVWAIGAAMVLASAAAAGRRKGSGNRRPTWRRHDNLIVVTGEQLEDYYEAEGIESYADLVGEELASDHFWYIPTDEEAASIEWANRYGYDPGIVLHESMQPIPGPPGEPEQMAYLIDPFAIQRVMWVDQVDRIPNLSDELPIQRMLWVMDRPDEDGWRHLSSELLEHLTSLYGDEQVFKVWDRIEGMIEDAYRHDDDGVREILQQATTPEAVYEAVWPQINTVRGLGGRRRALFQFKPQRGER